MTSTLSAAPLLPAGGADPRAPLAPDAVLSVRGLKTVFGSGPRPVVAVDDVSFDLRRGETVALVGESGSGKSVTCLSIMGLIDEPGRVAAGEILFRRRSGAVLDLAQAPERALRDVRGNEVGMIFQEPMTSLNPIFTVGDQIGETLRQHRGASRGEAWREAAAMLDRVGIAEPERRLRQYPHELSGGMRQRVMIAMALACAPSLLVADEPTTALDVTIQAQIIDLMRDLQAGAGGMGLLFITHDMGVVAEIADRVVVMYGARVMEEAAVRDIFHASRHPYTRGLLASMPRAGGRRRAGAGRRLIAIPGNVARPSAERRGCVFAARCTLAIDLCRKEEPPLAAVGDGHRARCFRAGELGP